MPVDLSKIVTKEMRADKERAVLVGQIAARRYQAETAGLTVAGVSIYSDRETRALIEQTLEYMGDDELVSWKTRGGEFVPLSKSELTNIAKCLFKYVQACFARERELVSVMATAEFADSMLEDGWPSQEAVS